jgi:protein-S-isoprenylcysteine O-methyltransferase Ste14
VANPLFSLGSAQVAHHRSLATFHQCFHHRTDHPCHTPNHESFSLHPHPRNPAFAIAYLLVKFSGLPWTALRIPALLLTIAGIAAVAVARYQLGNSFTLSPQARTVVTDGPYSKIRNPVYVFSAIALAGLFVYIDRPMYLVSFLALIPLQFVRAHIESRVLEEKFGDTYLQYKPKTWF